MGITIDNASNNIIFINVLSDWMKEKNVVFNKNNHFKYFTHIINLSIQIALNSINDNLSQVLTFTAASDKDLKNFVITDDNWNQLELIKGFFELFKEITNIMFGFKYSILFMMIPLYNELITHTEEYLETRESIIPNDFLKKAVKNCNKKLLEYYNKINNAYLIATILDSRFKMSYYKQNEWGINL
ncbi:zinc finger BED domain-containing protein RICESLEEPER 2-like [Rhizophagus clarus]|uniref:Zinc finger BED domain-containing protein RICESLEEPER 2-like n=1 Tax=Rhizophagus clarus TaxID=94130 RepID=A0A8H3R0N0_9GLOM|nr:zinc finger BED domain-containing protein RICESLEEPER 2-like [Rhizophagus clarus]